MPARRPHGRLRDDALDERAVGTFDRGESAIHRRAVRCRAVSGHSWRCRAKSGRLEPSRRPIVARQHTGCPNLARQQARCPNLARQRTGCPRLARHRFARPNIARHRFARPNIARQRERSAYQVNDPPTTCTRRPQPFRTRERHRSWLLQTAPCRPPRATRHTPRSRRPWHPERRAR